MSALLHSTDIPHLIAKIESGFSFDCSFDPETAAPGTCGELVQGIFQGHEFLINSPIPSYAAAAVKIFSGTGVFVLNEGNWTKVQRAVEKALAALFPQHTLGAIVHVRSSLPRGKGFASSTAEMTAALYALGKALSIDLSSDFITHILLAIDKSTDGIYLPGVSILHHLTGSSIAKLGAPPPLAFLAVDDGGEVDTYSFDREKARAVAKKHLSFYSWAVRSMKRAFAKQDIRTIGHMASESARINQEVLPKRLFKELLLGCQDVGAVGVNCAHTGSALGVMYNPETCDSERLRARVEHIAGKERILGNFRLISGKNSATASYSPAMKMGVAS